MLRLVLAGAIGAVFALAAAAAAIFAVPAANSGSVGERLVVFEQFKGGVGTEIVINKKKGVPYVAGNYAVFRSPLRDGGPTGARIGINEAVCLHNFTHDMCRGTFTINGRGTISFEGLASLAAAPHAHDFAITSGTGEFLEAEGLVHSDALGPNAKGFTWEITILD